MAAASRLCFDVRGVVILDHLDAGSAIFGDLINVGPFHQSQADVSMAQAVGRAPASLSVKFEIQFVLGCY